MVRELVMEPITVTMLATRSAPPLIKVQNTTSFTRSGNLLTPLLTLLLDDDRVASRAWIEPAVMHEQHHTFSSPPIHLSSVACRSFSRYGLET